MVIKIYGNHIEGCGTGISAPADANLEIGANHFVACGKAIDLRAPETVLGVMGLRVDTPIEVLREMLTFVGEKQPSPIETEQKASSAGWLKWLSAGSDSTTLVSGLAALYPHIHQILAGLPG